MKNRKNIVLYITVLTFLGMFIGNYGNYQLAAVPGSVYEAYSLTDAQFSSIMTAPMFPSIFLSIIIGILVDRMGISKLVGICYTIASVGFVIRLFATNYATMFIAMALTGIGCMILNSNLAKIVSALYPMEKVGSVIGILMAGSTASMAVAFGTTAFFPSLELAFWVAAIASIVVTLGWLLVVREKHFKADNAPVVPTVPVKEAVSVCLKSRNIWLAGIALMLMLGGATVISNFQVTALKTLRGYTEAFAGTFGTVLMVGSIVGSIFVPVALGKSPRHAPLMLLIFGLLSAGTMVVMVLTESVAVNYVCCFLNGGLRSGFIAAMMSLPVLFKEVGPKYAGTGGGLMVTLELIGAVLIPTYVVVPLGGGSVLNYFYLGAICIAASAVLCFVMAKTSGAYATKKETV